MKYKIILGKSFLKLPAKEDDKLVVRGCWWQDSTGLQLLCVPSHLHLGAHWDNLAITVDVRKHQQIHVYALIWVNTFTEIVFCVLFFIQVRREIHTWPAFWFPPLTTSFYPSFLTNPPHLLLLNRLPMNPLPTDTPPATVSILCPSPTWPGRGFLPRLTGTRSILLQLAQEKEKRTVTRYEWNQICLTCLAAMAVFHAGGECHDWASGM